MDIKKIESVAGNVIVPVNHVKVKVSFGCGIMPEFAETYVNAMNQRLAARGSSLSFDRNEMEKYLNTLLKYRIDRVNGTGKNEPNARLLKVPALYALSLTHVGPVFDKDLGVELVPILESNDSNSDVTDEVSGRGRSATIMATMNIQEALDFSRKLLVVEDLGFELVEGLPKEREGDSDFMYFHMSADSILRHDKGAHPGIAVLTAFFRMKQLENILTFRVNYGLISEYEEMLKGLIYDEAR